MSDGEQQEEPPADEPDGPRREENGAGIALEDVVQATVRALLTYEEQRERPRGHREEPPERPQPEPRLKNSEIAELLPNFSGADDDVDHFIQRVDTVKSIYDVSEVVLPVIVAGKLTGQAKRWFQSKVDHLRMNWDDLADEMCSVFRSRPSKMATMRTFEQRRWKRSENFASYFSDKVSLGNAARIGERDMVDYIIDGMDNSILESQARMQQFKCPGDLLQAMQGISNGDQGRAASGVTNVRKTGAQSRLSTTPRSSGPNRCFNCNQPGHILKDCPKPKRAPGSCFECGAENHRIKDCPKKKSTSAVSAPADSTTHIVSTPGLAPAYTTPIYLKLRHEDKYRVEFLALIDSGSPVSLITTDLVPSNLIEPVTVPCEFFGVNQSRLDILGMFKRNVEVQNVNVNVNFYVVSPLTISASVLLGRDLMSEGKLKIILGDTVQIVCDEVSDSKYDCACNEILNIDFGFDAPAHPNLVVGQGVDYQKRLELESKLHDNYVRAERPSTPKTQVTMKLSVKTQNAPFFFHPRRLSFSDKLQLSELLDDLMKKGIIRKSTSPYASPIVLVRRKTGAIRLCVDYRELNKLTERDNYPLPLIDDLIDSLKGKKIFSVLDLQDAFHHVNVDPESVKFTSFVTPLGQHEYIKMPFGLKNSPATFMRFVNMAFRDLIDSGKVMIYIDDILIATETVDENLAILDEVYAVLVQNLMTLRLDKCRFLQAEIIYLGYKIDAQGITPSPENVDSVVNFPKPTSFKILRSFLGLCSYFRRFVSNFAIIMKPLYDLLKAGNKTNTPFLLGPEHLESFEKIKSILSSSPVLSIYSPHLETELHCDASAQGFASILVQRQKDGQFHPVFYFSRRTTAVEAKYHSFELECLAIVYSLERFRIYLQGLRFTIVTDCNSLKLTLEKKDVNPRIMRWTLILNNFDYLLQHRRNERMRHVDALSRCFLLIADNSFEKILGLMQEKDADICDIRNQLQERDIPNYELRDGSVYRKVGTRLLFYVPSCMIDNVIRTCHDDVGHPGITKVMDLIDKLYWFPSRTERVKEYIRKCLKCITYSPQSGKREGYLHPIPKGEIPFQTLHVDHLGPLAETGSHYKYVFVVVDAFSRFSKLYACKTTNAKEVLKHLSAYFSAYSRPVRVIADRDSTFRSNEFKEYLTNCGTQLVLIARRTPRSNGAVERFNRTIKPMLAKLSVEIHKWDRVLEDVEFSLNNTICRTTGKCPSELVFGLRQKGKVLDLVSEYLSSLEKEDRDLTDLRSDAAERIKLEQQISKEYYDKKHKSAHKYQVGDYVMCTNLDVTPGVNKKLLPVYKGPYEVVKILGNDRYYVKDIDGYQLTQIPYEGVLAASDMRPFLEVLLLDSSQIMNN